MKFPFLLKRLMLFYVDLAITLGNTKPKALNLSDYVKRRNGVPLGSNKSLGNMLVRSLGAGRFSEFWKYWNPIWGYYLGKYIFKPLNKIFPRVWSLLITFTFCGFIHDLAIMLIKRDFQLLLAPWFLLMGLCVILGDYGKIDYSQSAWIVRALINISIISGCLYMAYQLRVS